MKQSKNNKNEIELIQTNKGFEEIFFTYFNPLKAYALTILNEDDTVNDILQEVFLNLWKKRKMLDPSLTLSPYLYKAVFNKCMNQIKHQKANLNFIKNKTIDQELQTLFLEGTNPTNQNMDTEKMQAVIQDSINNLPEQCKKIFILSRKFGLKNREVAAFQGISIKSVEKQISKALKVLRDKLSSEFKDIF